MRFDTEITFTGPWRAPAQLLAEQEYDGHASVHDDSTAESLVASGTSGRIEAVKRDGSPVLSGTASIGPDHGPTELEGRLAKAHPGELRILDRLEIGATQADAEPATIRRDERNGAGYPFSLDEKLARITEPHPWYTEAGAGSSPWGRAVVPLEMLSVLAHKAGVRWPVRTPVLGLFLDLEVRLLDGPVFVDQGYEVAHELVGLGQSRRTESYWTRTTLTDAATGRPTATVLLHSGVFKDSHPG